MGIGRVAVESAGETESDEDGLETGNECVETMGDAWIGRTVETELPLCLLLIEEWSNSEGDSGREGGVGAGIDGRAGDREGGEDGFNGDETFTVELELEDINGGGSGIPEVIALRFPWRVGEAGGGTGEELGEARSVIGIAANRDIYVYLLIEKHRSQDIFIHTRDYATRSESRDHKWTRGRHLRAA